MQKPLSTRIVFQVCEHTLDTMTCDELVSLHERITIISFYTFQEWALAYITNTDYCRKQKLLDTHLLILDSWLDYRTLYPLLEPVVVTFPCFIFVEMFALNGPVIAGEPHIPVLPEKSITPHTPLMAAIATSYLGQGVKFVLSEYCPRRILRRASLRRSG